MAKKKEKKAGKRMKKRDLANLVMSFFQEKQGEVIGLKYLFSELRLTTHPIKMLCMVILYALLAVDDISYVVKD